MAKFESPLNNIKIASPCSANWDEMYGNERKRFCGDCKLNVYNLSGMSRDEAETTFSPEISSMGGAGSTSARARTS